METIREKERDTPIAASCDICVVGGSATGVFAAVAAARLGARVAIIERNGFLGGTATAGLVNIWHSVYDLGRRQRIIAGLTQEVIDRLEKRDAVTFGPTDLTYAMLNTDELTIELDNLVQESGVQPFLHCIFAAPLVEDGRVQAIIVEDKTGRRAITASNFVDATGDGDLIARAGLPWTKRDDPQPPTTCAVLYGLDEIRKKTPEFKLKNVVFDPERDGALRQGFLWSAKMTGAPDLDLVFGTRVNGADCSDADDLTRAEIEGRRQVRAICDILKRDFKGADAISLVRLSSSIGIRETRHAECLYTLSEKDVLHGTRFPDAIANGSYPSDIHHSEKPGITFRFLDGREEYKAPGRPIVRRRWLPEGEAGATFWQVPYRSLIPQGSPNVLAAGRLIAADRAAYGAIRVMVSCNQTGQAAGVASYLAMQSRTSVADIDPDRLRQTLRDQGATII